MKESFVKKRFSNGTYEVIHQANSIIEEYAAKGYTLTVRQLYYQFVARDFIPNSMRSYKRIASIISDARLSGLLDWAAIEDRTRFVRNHSFWRSPAAIIDSSVACYDIDMWADQDFRPEVWVEKDALIGVVERACNLWQIPYFACKGYNSQSEAYDAGKRIARHDASGHRPVILHLGDHDPSGIDMTRDNKERISMFSGLRTHDFDFKRIALNYDQIEQYNPPPNPTKLTDSRARGYINEFGNSSWELDALAPEVIEELISTEVQSFLDKGLWEEANTRKEAGKDQLREVVAQLENN